MSHQHQSSPVLSFTQPVRQQENAQGKDPGSQAEDHSRTYSGTQGCPLGHDGYTRAV